MAPLVSTVLERNMTFRPLLAAQLEDASTIKYPVLVSPKIDGIRCLILNGAPVTRSLKPIPNRHVHTVLSNCPAFDGELTVGIPNDPKTWNETSSAVMSHDGEPAFTFHVFDMCDSPSLYSERLRRASALAANFEHRGVKLLPHVLVQNASELLLEEQRAVAAGYEGLMLRDPGGKYKHGRSTLREGTLLKMKRFDHSEAKIVDFKERNEHVGLSKINALGLQERDHKRENFAPCGDLGAFICEWYATEGKFHPVQFDVGSGFTADMRVHFWNVRNKHLGKIIRIKHQGKTPDGKPRFPIFEGFRDLRDMSHG
jgi:DNA ligase-1